MDAIKTKLSIGSNLDQVAWVVKDINSVEGFFRNILGVDNFGNAIKIRAQEFEGTYYGEPSNAEWLVSIAYSGGAFVELIQPITGRNIFQDYLEKNPEGGVQHIAYSIPIADFNAAIAELTDKGYPIITSLNMPVAKIVFFDTYKDIGVVTEVIGITEAGIGFVQKLKKGKE